jgi:hypothetical protein
MTLEANKKIELCFDNVAKYERFLNSRSMWDFNYNELERLLIKTDLEDYTSFLYSYGLFNKFYKDQLYSIDTLEEFEITYANEEKELLQLLIFLLSDTDSDITFRLKRGDKTADNLTFSNDKIKSGFIEMVKYQYEKCDFNEENLTPAEAEDEIKNMYDTEWIQQYIEKCLADTDERVFYPQITTISDFDGFVDDDMINEYAYEHYTKRDITLDYLKTKLDQYNNKYVTKPGAKPKNDDLSRSKELLSYLIRLNKFLNQNEYNDIESFPIQNKDCILIYDYLRFFDLTDDLSSNTNSTKPHNKIRSDIDNFRKYRKPKLKTKYPFFDAESSINLFKRNNKIKLEIPF